MAILAALLHFGLVVAGFRNDDLVELVGSLVDRAWVDRRVGNPQSPK